MTWLQLQLRVILQKIFIESIVNKFAQNNRRLKVFFCLTVTNDNY